MKNCIRCGKLMFDLNRVCLECREREEEEYRLVSEHLRRHPGSTIPEIHASTGVKEVTIMSFIRKGRIVADGVPINCSVCGKEYSGSKSLMCPACTAKMEKDMQRVAGEAPPKAKPADPSPKKPKPPGGKDDRAFSTIRKTKI